ncbi:MAG: endonuclease domain-containing protein [Cyclobacteriaceae bacterium]|nr:endonuclease domain-containing protein [Cyclobacteriaceae bacterium HetDA_MAG_MS6]
MKNNYHYNKNLKTFARDLRNNSTQAEIRLWSELLRAGTLRGYKFLRQRPIGNYIADFMCKKLKLIIEVDGYSHNFKNNEDKVRDKELLKLGFQTVRFSDKEVMNDLPNVQRTLEMFIDEFEEKNNHPPNPLQRGN